jgi:hypothetical protein
VRLADHERRDTFTRRVAALTSGMADSSAGMEMCTPRATPRDARRYREAYTMPLKEMEECLHTRKHTRMPRDHDAHG